MVTLCGSQIIVRSSLPTPNRRPRSSEPLIAMRLPSARMEKPSFGPPEAIASEIPAPDSARWAVGQRIWLRFSTSSTRTVAALFMRAVAFAGNVTVHCFRSMLSPALFAVSSRESANVAPLWIRKLLLFMEVSNVLLQLMKKSVA